MLPIRKRPTPALLLRYQYARDAKWDGTVVEEGDSTLTFKQVKDELRTALVSEQYGLCAYCMRSIASVSSDVRIEHVQCQSKYPERQLDYKNMVACCHGQLNKSGSGKSRCKTMCCDRSKGDEEISFDPAHLSYDISLHLQYDREGRITADRELLQHDLDISLNLNSELLRLNREAVYKALIKSVAKKFVAKPVTLKWIEREIQANEER